jgi:hypothetical protein
MESNMKRYIGVKEINAKPMKRAVYNVARGWTLPADENGDDDGYLVEYIDGGQANTTAYAGYVSWSPSDVFERAYKPMDGMTFGLALEALKKGQKVARKGWNGKGMWLVLVPGTPVIYPTPDTPYGKAGVTECEILPHIDMWTTNAHGRRAMLPGWLASQTDMLSEDWEVI